MHLGGGILVHQHWLGCHLMGVLLLLRRVWGVWGLVNLIHWRIMRIAIHGLCKLWRLLAIQTSAMLIMRLRRSHRCRRVGLRSVVNRWIRALHVCGCCHRIWCICLPTSALNDEHSTGPERNAVEQCSRHSVSD